jgi:DNA-binding Lrp family transcriptional regulator
VAEATETLVLGEAADRVADLSEFERRLLNDFQHDFPLVPRPYAELARRLDSDEAMVIEALGRLQAQGLVSRIGAALAPHEAGWSTLAAMAVPEARLEDVAGIVSRFGEVNHNYEREHAYNLWFVVAAPDRARVEAVLAEIEAATGLAPMSLPLEEAHRLNLGFPLQWD